MMPSSASEHIDRILCCDAGANLELYYELYVLSGNVALSHFEFYADDCTGMNLPGIPPGEGRDSDSATM